MNLDSLINVIREFFLSWFVWPYCAAILAFLCFWVLRLSSKSRALDSKLQAWTSKMRALAEGGQQNAESKFVKAFEEHNEGMERDFGTPWKEFVETLIEPDPDSNDPIRNAHEVSRYLNDSTIISPKVPFDFYRSVPNLLTGFGILGTFIGLATGVGAASSGLSSNDPGVITASLQRLLGGASLAFLTSIVGISSSMVFVFFERRESRRLYLALAGWVKSIELCIRRVTSEEVALKQLKQLRSAAGSLERFNTELIFTLQDALEERITDRLLPQLDRLLGALDGLRHDRSSEAGQMIEHALNRFTEAMKEQTGSQFDDMASIVGDLNRTLKDSVDGMARSQRDIQSALDSVVKTVTKAMDSGANSMTEALQRSLEDVTRQIAEASAGLAHKLRSSSATATEEMQKAVATVTDDLMKTAVQAALQITGSLHGMEKAAESLSQSTQQSGRMLDDMTGFVDQINSLRRTIDSAHRGIKDSAEPIRGATRDIRVSSDRTADTLAKTTNLVERVDTSMALLEKHQESIAKAWLQYQERFAGIDRSLAQVFRQIDEGLSGYCEQVKVFANELDQTTSKTIQDLASVTHELGQSVEDLTASLPRSA
jgi:methyl-accepting chemotaxis protein